MSVISKIKSLQHRNEEALTKFCGELSDIEDKHSLFDIFIKEYIKLDEDDYTFSACLLKSIIPNDYITEKSLELLKSASLSDECKYKVVQLLRITGGNYDYSEIPEYFDNPQEVIDLETKRLLDSAVFNPESMLDFLDFVSAVSENDRTLLLSSLSLDYKGDSLANIVYPILYSDFNDNFILQAIDILCESKSSLAIAPFEYLIEVSKNSEIVNACQKGLKILKLAGATKEKADDYFKNIIKTSKPSKFYVTIPDGSGKQALLTTREHNDGNFSLTAVVISDISGIVDCFGFFNISQAEINKVINKFYKSEGQYIVPKEYVKSRINFAHNITINKKYCFPYEYICWFPIFYDIEPLSDSLMNYIQNNCKKETISKDDVIELLTKGYTLRWFIEFNDNEYIKEITDKIYSAENINIFDINQMIKQNTNKVFDENTLNIWIDRIYNLIYILIQNNKPDEASQFYSIINNDNLLLLFKQIILQRSIFNYFVILSEKTKESFLTTNIFRKRNSAENKYDAKKVKAIINLLKRGWLEG